ncbi:MAG TPA: hypothetical protein PLW95_05695 [bacterium]|nr:hypothetical protein [bacterium]
MKAGFFQLDITPFIGMERPSGYRKAYADFIHDPTKVRSCIIEDGNEEVAIVVSDTLVSPPRENVIEIKEEIEKKVGIKKENILIGATHTHSAGPLFFPFNYQDADPLTKKLISEYSTISDPFYYEIFKRKVVDSLICAEKKKEDVICNVGYGYEDKVSFNRRFKMKNNRVYTHPGKNNPDIIEPAGPIDHSVGVLTFWNKDKSPIGTFINFACHLTTGPGGISADWLFYTEKIIKKIFEDMDIILLQGASGDITQVNNLSDRVDFGEKISHFVGTRVGLEALKIILTEEKGSLSPLKIKNKIINVKRRKQSEEKLKMAREIVENGLKNENIRQTTEWTFAKERIILDYLTKKQPEVEIEIQAIQIGPVIIISSPGEIFSSTGLKVKKASHFPITFFVELSNGFLGYIPDRKAFLPTGGGFETVLTSESNLEVDAEEKIIEESLKLMKEFKPGELPEYDKITSKPQVWSYGILGPDID